MTSFACTPLAKMATANVDASAADVIYVIFSNIFVFELTVLTLAQYCVYVNISLPSYSLIAFSLQRRLLHSTRNLALYRQPAAKKLPIIQTSSTACLVAHKAETLKEKVLNYSLLVTTCSTADPTTLTSCSPVLSIFINNIGIS